MSDKDKSVKKSPNLRFPGFQNSWKILKLRDISKRVNEKNTNNYLDLVFSNSAVQGIVLQNDYFEKSIANKNNLQGYYIVKPLDFVYNPRISANAEVGAMNINNTFKTGLVSPLYTVFRINSTKVLHQFLEIYFKSKHWHHHMREIANYGARDDRMNIKNDDFYDMDLQIPQIDEQIKITSFLSKIILKIETQKKTISELEKYIQILRDELFSQKIRFNNHLNEHFPKWSEQKLEDICEKQSSSISANSIEDNIGEFPIFGATGFLKNIDFYQVESEYIAIIKDGAGVGRMLYCKEKSSVLGTLDILKAKDVNLQFLFYLLSRIDFSKYSTGSTIPHIYFKDYKNEKVMVPCVDEQNRIATFLSKLSEKILIESKIMNLLKQQKKYLLQNLFI